LANLGQVYGDVKVMVQEAAVLLRVQQLQQGRGGVALRGAQGQGQAGGQQYRRVREG
jgi:hypothetical protein